MSNEQKKNKYFRYRTQNVAYVHNYLLHHPCVDCNETDVRVLDFDHVRGYKSKSIAKMLSGTYGIRTIIKEIQKCDVRCSNCHRKITSKRANTFSNVHLNQEVDIVWINKVYSFIN